MKKIHSVSNRPRIALDAFETFDGFARHARGMFDLSDVQLRLLYQVMIKLQNMGQDPLEALNQCKYQMEEQDCLGMLKLMIQVEDMDLHELLGDHQCRIPSGRSGLHPRGSAKDDHEPG